jgi:hypothetical protein
MKLFTLALIALIALAALIMAMAVMQPTAENGTVPLKINASPTLYTLAMSSTPGIGLTPVFPDSIDNSTVSFRWQTNYGRFLSWNAPDFKINEQGMNVTVGDGKIYWSYLYEEGKVTRPPVHISLTMIDKATGKTLGTAGREIAWDEHDLAVVRA